MFDLNPSTDIELLQLRIDGEKVTRLFLNLSDVPVSYTHLTLPTNREV